MGLAKQSFMPQLKDSRSAGERLAAITALEVCSEEGSLDWLVERIEKERPFFGYHTALALLSAARAFTVPDDAAPDSAAQKITPDLKRRSQRTRDSINKAIAILEKAGKLDTDRYEVLKANQPRKGHSNIFLSDSPTVTEQSAMHCTAYPSLAVIWKVHQIHIVMRVEAMTGITAINIYMDLFARYYVGVRETLLQFGNCDCSVVLITIGMEVRIAQSHGMETPHIL